MPTRFKPNRSVSELQGRPGTLEDLAALPLVRVPGRQTADAAPIAVVAGPESPLVPALQAAFDVALSEEPLLSEIVQVLRRAGMAFGVLGGWVRDQLLALDAEGMNAVAPRDIDLVVANTTHDVLREVLPQPTSRTIFGGFTFTGKQLDIDMWAANDTFLTSRLGLPSDLPHVLAVTDFNINAIVFLPSQGGKTSGLIDGGAIESLTTKTIAFHFEQIALPLPQVARLLAFSRKLGFSLDESVCTFIRDQCTNDDARAAIRDNLSEHYAESEVVAAMSLLESVLSGEGRGR
jgi:hypothetical protein